MSPGIEVVRNRCICYETIWAGSKFYLVSKIMNLFHSQFFVQKALHVSKFVAEDAVREFRAVLSYWDVVVETNLHSRSR